MSYESRQAAAARLLAAARLPLLALLLLLPLVPLLTTACGKPGPPTPPFRAVPAPSKDLLVRQRGTHLILSFRYPDTAPGGQALGGVSKVEVYEADIPAPTALGASDKDKKKKEAAAKEAAAKAAAAKGAASGTSAATAGSSSGATTAAASAGPTSPTTTAPSAAPAPSAATAASPTTASSAAAASPTTQGSAATPGAASTGATAGAKPATAAVAPAFAAEPLEGPMLAKLAKLKLTLTTKDLTAATVGNFLVIDLPLTETLPAEVTAEQPTRSYAVRTYGPKGDRSDFSNQILLKVKVPPHSPEGVVATAQADGVMVEWKPVPGAAGNYAVYRRAASDRANIRPLALVPATETRYLDEKAVFGQSYIYSVTAVDAKETLVESPMQSEMEIHYVDRFPPPVPGDLVAVAETGRARLVWRQSEASDLAGYIVYRKGPEGDFVRVTEKPIDRTAFVDEGVTSGKTYLYRVTAIDQSGNESAPSGEVSVAIP